jgi:hypothetical protein
MVQKKYKNLYSCNNKESFENSYLNIDKDFSEIIGESQIIIGETTYLLNDYKYYLLAFTIILVILIARSIT